MSDAAIRVLVADDHPVVRGGLTALLSTLEGVEVVAEAGDGAAACREALVTRPDVAIIDLRMPGLDGVETTRRLTSDLPGVAVIILTMFDEDEEIADALAAGARGYLLKGAQPDEIDRAVRTVAAGGAVLSPEVAARVLGGSLRRSAADPFPQLTAREREVLDLIARGAPNHAIGEWLGIAAKTVGNHISAIFLKLGIATRAEAIVMARQGGLGR